LSLCHIYFEETVSHHIEHLKSAFDGVSLDLNDIDELSDYDVYIVELDFATKEVSLKLRALFKEKQNPLIYFIVTQKHNLMLFQLTYFLQTKDIITQGQKTQKIIEKIASELENREQKDKELEVQEDIELVDEVELVEDVVPPLESITSRITFMDVLKETLAHNKQTALSAITINIHNIHKIQKDIGLVALEEYLDDTVIFMESLFEDRLIFSQLDREFYIVLLSDEEFEDIKNMANEFHNLVLDNMAHKEFKFVIDVFTSDFTGKSFADVVSLLNNIKNKDFDYTQMHSDTLEYTSQTQGVITEKSVLIDAYNTKAEIKLLNIYNGLVVSTPSNIVKMTDDNIYIKFEQLQGVVMKMEKETILQSNTFMQDILAKIKAIDSKKKIAVLEGFKFLQTNANSRKYARVTTSSKIPINIRYENFSINGNILDLSIKSIAIKTKCSKKIDSIKNEDVRLTFNIPNYRFDEGYTQLRLMAKVIVVLPYDNDGNCKVVCDFEDGSDDESIIKEYVYDRQKELIVEIKKMSKLH
jgi:hypothetical protein